MVNEFSNRLQFSYDLLDTIGAELDGHSRFANIDFVHQQFDVQLAWEIK